MNKEFDQRLIRAAALYNELLPNGGSFHNLSPSTQTYKNFMKLAAEIEGYQEIQQNIMIFAETY